MYNNNIELLKRAKKGEKSAVEKLIECNMGLVKKIASRFLSRGIEFEDCVQIGAIGLYKAIEKFDFSFDVQFSTYAVPMIMGEIRRFLRDDGMIKVSRSIKENYYKISRFLEEYRLRFESEPQISIIENALGINKEDIITALSFSPVCESLNAVTSDEKNTLEDKIITGVDEEEQLIERLSLYEALEMLDEREKKIIEQRYFHDLTQNDVARQLDISQVQVSRLEKKILEKMKNKLIYS